MKTQLSRMILTRENFVVNQLKYQLETLTEAMIAAKKDSPIFTKNARNCFAYQGISEFNSNIYNN